MVQIRATQGGGESSRLYFHHTLSALASHFVELCPQRRTGHMDSARHGQHVHGILVNTPGPDRRGGWVDSDGSDGVDSKNQSTPIESLSLKGRGQKVSATYPLPLPLKGRGNKRLKCLKSLSSEVGM